jgi:hypothetical protein
MKLGGEAVAQGEDRSKADRYSRSDARVEAL